MSTFNLFFREILQKLSLVLLRFTFLGRRRRQAAVSGRGGRGFAAPLCKNNSGCPAPRRRGMRCAWGKPDSDSDLDLFVVMESGERPIKRAASVRSVLRDLYVPMDILVRTPEELRYRIDIGDPFIKKILRDGQVIYARDSADNSVKYILSRRGQF